MASIDDVMDILLSTRTWGEVASRYALHSMYDRKGIEFVLGVMDHPCFVKGDIPDYRVGILLKHMPDGPDKERVREKVKELGIVPKFLT